jgi:hypothetical protein
MNAHDEAPVGSGGTVEKRPGQDTRCECSADPVAPLCDRCVLELVDQADKRRGATLRLAPLPAGVIDPWVRP